MLYGSFMSNESSKPAPLTNGCELSLSEFQRRRTDVKYLVASGGWIYLTEQGKRRMAIVPVEVAEEHELSTLSGLAEQGRDGASE